MSQTNICLRRESRLTERRTPLSPEDARTLIKSGLQLWVETSTQRIFKDGEYENAGCTMIDSWETTPTQTWILGLKELKESAHLCHRHIYFAHAFKGQPQAQQTLSRFVAGGGGLYDLEYLTHPDGTRVVAFGFWAGYMGASLGVLQMLGKLNSLETFDHEDLQAQLQGNTKDIKALIIGPGGRCGAGAASALSEAHIQPTGWGKKHTKNINHEELFTHHLLINAVGTYGNAKPFLTKQLIDEHKDRKLHTIVDVTCDLGSKSNALPIYKQLTTWKDPAQEIAPNLYIIAIDNLPSLLPKESSLDFSRILTPHLLTLEQGGNTPWTRTYECFQSAIANLEK